MERRDGLEDRFEGTTLEDDSGVESGNDNYVLIERGPGDCNSGSQVVEVRPLELNTDLTSAERYLVSCQFLPGDVNVVFRCTPHRKQHDKTCGCGLVASSRRHQRFRRPRLASTEIGSGRSCQEIGNHTYTMTIMSKRICTVAFLCCGPPSASRSG